jgi:hypothetical protein
MPLASMVLPVPADEPEHVVRHGPLGSLYIAMQPAGQVIVQVSWPGAVQVNADAGPITPDAAVLTARMKPNSHFMRAPGRSGAKRLARSRFVHATTAPSSGPSSQVCADAEMCAANPDDRIERIFCCL